MTTKLPGMYAEVEEYVPPDSDAPYFSGILTLVDGKGYFVYHRTLGGASGSTHSTFEEASAALEEKREFHRKFWQEKVDWKNNGDRTPEGNWCLRINGNHYVCKPNDKGSGFGGRKFRWQMLVNGKEACMPIHVTNNMWHQGTIPPEFRDELPDNAIWVENTSAVG